MKELALIICSYLACSAFGQDYPNPFKEIGKDVEILTLSNGEYDEFFPNDTIRRIGTVMFNTIEMKIDCFVSEEELKAEAMPEGHLVSRWLSRDPLAAKYPSINPYNFVSNNPILYVDPDGQDNIIYLVNVPNGEGQTKYNSQEIAIAANRMLSKLGVETRVVVFTPSKEGEKFDPSFIDATDSWALVGEPEDLISYTETSNLYIGDVESGSLENAHKDGTGIWTPTDDVSGYAEELGISEVETVAFSIVHGAGHNADNLAEHSCSSCSRHQHLLDSDRSEDMVNFMAQGSIVASVLTQDENALFAGERQDGYASKIFATNVKQTNPNTSTLSDLFEPDRNKTNIRNFQRRYGSNKPSDNYERNKAERGASND